MKKSILLMIICMMSTTLNAQYNNWYYAIGNVYPIMFNNGDNVVQIKGQTGIHLLATRYCSLTSEYMVENNEREINHNYKLFISCIEKPRGRVTFGVLHESNGKSFKEDKTESWDKYFFKMGVIENNINVSVELFSSYGSSHESMGAIGYVTIIPNNFKNTQYSMFYKEECISESLIYNRCNISYGIGMGFEFL